MTREYNHSIRTEEYLKALKRRAVRSTQVEEHDPLCLTLEDEGFSVAYFGTAEGSDHIACLSCYLIGKVEDRALAAQIDHYNNGRDMGLAEAREAIIAVPWRTGLAGAEILRGDAIDAIDDLRS